MYLTTYTGSTAVVVVVVLLDRRKALVNSVLDQVNEGLGLELGAAQPTTTQSYTRVSNQKVRNDYFKGMEKILATTQGE